MTDGHWESSYHFVRLYVDATRNHGSYPLRRIWINFNLDVACGKVLCTTSCSEMFCYRDTATRTTFMLPFLGCTISPLLFPRSANAGEFLMHSLYFYCTIRSCGEEFPLSVRHCSIVHKHGQTVELIFKSRWLFIKKFQQQRCNEIPMK